MAGKTFFLVDDDPDDREIFGTTLKSIDNSLQFMYAVDGKDAINQLTTELVVAPDFIFLDLNMPGMTGKECLRAFRKMRHLALTPVIIYSTSKNLRDIEETKMLGAAHFLTKPDSISDLRAALQTILKMNWD